MLSDIVTESVDFFMNRAERMAWKHKPSITYDCPLYIEHHFIFISFWYKAISMEYQMNAQLTTQ